MSLTGTWSQNNVFEFRLGHVFVQYTGIVHAGQRQRTVHCPCSVLACVLQGQCNFNITAHVRVWFLVNLIRHIL